MATRAARGGHARELARRFPLNAYLALGEWGPRGRGPSPGLTASPPLCRSVAVGSGEPLWAAPAEPPWAAGAPRGELAALAALLPPLLRALLADWPPHGTTPARRDGTFVRFLLLERPIVSILLTLMFLLGQILGQQIEFGG